MDQIIELRRLEKKGDNQSIKDILFNELRFDPNNLDILDFLLKYMDDYEILHKYGEDYINIIFELQESFPKNYKARLYVLQAKLMDEHYDPQVAWETLVEGLIHFPNSDEIIKSIESIFDYAFDAPEASDSMEKLGELVAKKEFPKDTFEYLLLICADPEFPELFDLAKRNTLG